jgi:DHA1 family multidrug resistance protein-like MFS transporter
MYAVGGVMILLTALPVWLLVRESPRPPKRQGQAGAIAQLRTHGGGMLAAIVALMVAQTLVQVVGGGAQPMFALRLLHIVPDRAAFFTGVAFAAAGGGTAIGALSYTWVANRIGYRSTAMVAAAIATVTVSAVAGAGWIPIVIVGIAIFGLVQGVLNPAVSSMIGMEAPEAVQATIFGFMSTAFAIGITLGPLLSGLIAAAFDASSSLYFAGAMGAVLFILLATRVREPVHDPSRHRPLVD